jgi:hypothetical protein
MITARLKKVRTILKREEFDRFEYNSKKSGISYSRKFWNR